jgi:hypothetical protein
MVSNIFSVDVHDWTFLSCLPLHSRTW